MQTEITKFLQPKDILLLQATSKSMRAIEPAKPRGHHFLIHTPKKLHEVLRMQNVNIEKIKLQGKFTDADLAKLPNTLKELDLSKKSIEVTDAGLAPLKNLPALQRLDL